MGETLTFRTKYNIYYMGIALEYVCLSEDSTSLPYSYYRKQSVKNQSL